MNELRAKIESALTALHSGYRDKVAALGAREADWQLCNSRIFTEVELLQTYAAATGLPVPEEEEVGEISRWPEISVDYLNFWCCLPGSRNGSMLTMFICDPYGIEQHRAFFRQLWGVDLTFVLVRRSVLEHLITATYSHEEINDQEEPGEDVETLKALAGEAKIVRLVNEMFNRAVEMRASDIHVEPEEE